MRNFLLGFLLGCCSFAMGVTVKSSLGDFEQPAFEWLVGKKGYIPVDNTPQRTIMSGQWTNQDNSIVIDWDTGHIQGQFVLHEQAPPIGEVYDLMVNGQMNLFGSGIEDTQLEIRDLPETIQ